MNIPDLSVAAERDTGAKAASRKGNGGGSAFGALVGSLDGRSSPRASGETATDAAECVDAESADEDASASRHREGAFEPALARDMLGLLGATGPRAKQEVLGEGAEGEGAKDGDDALAAGQLLREAGSDVAALARGKVKLEVVKMETHFEPGPREDVVVLDEEHRAAGKAERESGLLQILAGNKSASAKGERENAGVQRPRFDETLARLGGSAETSDVDASMWSTDRVGRPFGEGAETRSSFRDGARSELQRAADARFAALAGADAPTSPVGTREMATAPMTGQVAARIIDAFSPEASGQQAPDLPPGETHLRMRAGGSALKTLTIQLQPESLGTLNVSMRLVDGELTLELAASRAETARVLLEDRASLRSLLEKAGFSVDDKAITVVARDSVATATAQRNEGGEGGAGRNGEGGASSRDQGEETRQRHPQKDRGSQGGEHGGEAVPRPSRSSSTYL